MSVLIKDLKMPKKGTCIEILIFSGGTVQSYRNYKKIGKAVELPDIEDLTDRDELLLYFSGKEKNPTSWRGNG